MTVISLFVVSSMLAGSPPALLGPQSTEQPSFLASNTLQEGLGEQKPKQSEAAPDSGAPSLSDSLLRVPAAAGIAGAVAGATGLGIIAGYTMAGGFATLALWPPTKSPFQSLPTIMLVAAPFVFGTAPLGSAAMAVALTWAFSDAGVGALTATAGAVALGFVIGVPVAAVGAAALAFGGLLASNQFIPSVGVPVLFGSALLAPAVAVVTVAAGIGTVTAAAAVGGDLSEAFISNLVE